MEASIETLRSRLGDWIEEAHAMEQRSLRELDVTLSALGQETRWPGVEDLGGGELFELFEQHRGETERHAALLRQRLDAQGRVPSRLKEAKSAIVGATASFIESAGADKPARLSRDAFAVEHMEIAAYELLERLAERAGDSETAEVARRNRADERRMAERLGQRWERVLDLTLAAYLAPPPAGGAGQSA